MIRFTPLQHQPDNRLRRRFIILFIQLGLAGDGCNLPVKVGIGLGRGPDAEHQVVGVDGGDLAAVDPGLDAVDVCLLYTSPSPRD